MPRSPVIASFAVVLVVLLLVGCAPGGAPGVRDLPADASQAEALYRDGDFRGAALAWLDAAERSRAHRDYYRLRAAEAWREEGLLQQAAQALADVRSRALSEDERQRLLLLQAELALADGQPQQVATLLALAPSRVLQPHRARFFELRGRAAEALGDRFGAALEYAELDPLLGGTERTDNARRIRQLLNTLSDHALRDGSTRLPAGAALQPYAARALTARGLAVPEAMRAQRRMPDGTLPVGPGPGRIALLLPQSGPLALAAATVRDGFMSAYFDGGSPRPQVRVFDSGETPEQAVGAYRQAVAAGADVVVGPLSRDSVTMLFAQPQLPVPLLALNRSLNPLPPGHLSFALAPEEEAAAIASRLQQNGLRRVLAVVGMDDSAQRALGGFTARHLQAGGELLGTVLVPDEGVDYLDPIRNTLLAANLPTSAPTDLKIAHDAGFDAVFMALRPSQARLAVPQLRIFGITEVPIFATSSINAADDGNRLDRDLNGIEFTEVPWLVGTLPGLPDRDALAARFDSARGPAARLFAFGIDAYRLLAERERLLRDGSALDGATGRLRIDPFGEVRREPGVATFRSQRARLVNANALLPGPVHATDRSPDGGPAG